MSSVTYTCDSLGIATLTLNRDEKRNAINNEMANCILDGLGRAEENNARVVVLRANPGAKVWCAGHDLSELDPQNLEQGNRTLEVCRRLQETPLPVVAMVEGRVFGGGLLLLLSVDLAVATQSASVAFTANKLGIPLKPHWYTLLVNTVGLRQAKELLFTAAPISAADAHRAGLYNHLTTAEDLAATAQAMVERMLECSPEGLAASKRTLNLLACEPPLSPSQRAEIARTDQALLDSPQVKARIRALLESLQR